MPLYDYEIADLKEQLAAKDDEITALCRECAEFKFQLKEAIAALSAVPTTDGWQLVPVEATVEMLAAWWRHKNGHYFHDEPPPTDTSDVGAYRAMLSAAPKREA